MCYYLVMIDLAFSPEWFFGKDVVIDLFSVLTLFLLTYFSLKYYKLGSSRKYLYLCISFFVIGVSFVLKILSNIAISHYTVSEAPHDVLINSTLGLIPSYWAIAWILLLLYRVLMLVGLYGLYSTYSDEPEKSQIVFTIFLLVIAAYFTRFSYFIFHLVALVLLGFITWRYLMNYKRTKLSTAKLLVYGFALITISQIFFVFTGLNPVLYVIGEIIQLLGFVSVLFTLILVLKHGKKKK